MRTLTLGFAALATAATASANIDEAATAPLEARGVVRAAHTAEIAAPMAARLSSVPFRDGAWFAKGATLATFDCAAMEAELEALQAARATLELRHANQSELFALGAAGELDVKLARSEATQAVSEARAIATRLEDCTLTAPWSGHVAQRHLQAHETPTPGQPIYSLVRSGRTEMTLIVPSRWSGWLRAGAEFDFTVDETGETVRAKVRRLGAVVDPSSQTMEVVASPTESSKAKPGMSGTAVFAQPTDD